MKFTRKIPGFAAAAAIGITAPLMIAASDQSATEDSPAEVEAALDAELAAATITFDEQMAVYEDCAERVGLTNNGIWTAAEETRQTRSDSFDCLAEAWPEQHGDTPTPLAPPADWDPTADQVAYQSDLTNHLSAAFTAEGVEHTIVTEDNGARWIDYDDLDPLTAATVSEIISRGDHYTDNSTE